MTPFWHAQATLLLAEPPCFANVYVMRMLLRSGGDLRLCYAGDRMWPAVCHGASIAAEPISDGALQRGSVVVASVDGIPDLLRVEQIDGTSLRLTADADPEVVSTVDRDDLLARTRLPCVIVGRARRTLRRAILDLREALTRRPDPSPDPADTVLSKYDRQAQFYSRQEGLRIEPDLLRRIRARVAPGRRILVVGSGSGRECFALAEEGWSLLGVDFSPTMVELSRRTASDSGSPVEFRLADLRGLTLEPSSLAAVVFTYDVYSFLPGSEGRTAALRRIRSWLEPGGCVFLSARRVHSAYARAILTLQWLARLARGEHSEWGDSHTRYIAPDGARRRSYVCVLPESCLRAEAAAAGFRTEPWRGAHCRLEPARATIPR